jgi:hypothetical protein
MVDLLEVPETTDRHEPTRMISSARADTPTQPSPRAVLLTVVLAHRALDPSSLTALGILASMIPTILLNASG